jgi:hypothetical protein
MDELDVAFVSVLATGALGVVGFLVTFFNGRADRRHARQLAQDSRLFESREDVYEEVLAQANRYMLTMERTYPIIGPQPDPPPPVPDEEWTRLAARISALGSGDVQAALRVFMEKGNGFVAQAKVFGMMEAQGRKVESDGYLEIERLRRETRSELDELAKKVNEELTAPVS